MKPILKWAGGKTQLLDEINRRIPDHNDYYEPFFGGGALLFYREPQNAHINDTNSELINLYNVIKDYPNELIELLSVHKENNSSDYYYRIRSLDRSPAYKTMTNIEKAARMFYLNKTCFNGLYRVNAQGFFNVPYANYNNPTIYIEEEVLALSRYLNGNVTITNLDFAQAVDDTHENDFVYFDPPYFPVSDTGYFTSYSKEGFTDYDQQRLKDCCDMLTARHVKWMVSNSDCDEVRELYNDYHIDILNAKRSINCKGSRRAECREIVIRNYEIPEIDEE